MVGTGRAGVYSKSPNRARFLEAMRFDWLRQAAAGRILNPNATRVERKSDRIHFA